MTIRRILLSLLLAGSITAPAVSHARVDVNINIAPPPPHVEVIQRRASLRLGARILALGRASACLGAGTWGARAGRV
jgi:hypothetical protein